MTKKKRKEDKLTKEKRISERDKMMLKERRKRRGGKTYNKHAK